MKRWAAIGVVLLLTGCGAASGGAATGESREPLLEPPTTVTLPPGATKPAATPGGTTEATLQPYGSTYVWPDGVRVSVAEPAIGAASAETGSQRHYTVAVSVTSGQAPLRSADIGIEADSEAGGVRSAATPGVATPTCQPHGVCSWQYVFATAPGAVILRVREPSSTIVAGFHDAPAAP